uniref:Uncharacterized protein n=1 Tax=viral metagenome TaxID=1070528 RepID=A0A6M3XGA6_9ZZZZ
MNPAQFAEACAALADFPTESEPDRQGRRKVVGIIGGEPLMHPRFPELVEIMCRAIPDPSHRGLWTGLDYHSFPKHRFAEAVDHLIGPHPTGDVMPVAPGSGGYLNQNQHNTDCFHQPVLVAIQDVIQDEARMWSLIDACPLQEEWSGTITPKGFFFCEVAGALDLIFDGPGGVQVAPGCWAHDLAEYRSQIERWCPRCGVCLPLAGRRDSEGIDDVSRSNLEALRKLGSPRILAGDYVEFDPAGWQPPEDWKPLTYLRSSDE